MKRGYLLFLFSMVGSGGIVLWEARLVATGDEKIQVTAQQLAHKTAEVTALRRQRDAVARDLDLAEQQLNRLTSITVAVGNTATAPDKSAEAWAKRAQQLRALVAENPSHVIPEMQLLTNEDWMRVAQHAAFEDDAQRRETLAALRSAAKSKFIPGLASAALRWVQANGSNQSPAGILELGPHFEPPADPAMLQRYQIVPPEPRSGKSSRPWRAQESVAVDEDYDTRYSAESNGGYGSSGGVLAWNVEYSTRLQRAYKGYMAANNGSRPADTALIVPFIDPPLPASTLETILRRDRQK